MEMMLAENILAFRKERSLTQEQLAEMLGVSVGAVYKWEAKLSVPELDRIVEMADFFDTSVDILLGYAIKDNRLTATVQRLKEYRRSKDISGLSEAEKALKKYPNCFQVIHECAVLYRAFGIESGNPDFFRRSLELLEKSQLLLSQNTDPEISELTLYGEMATAYQGLDEWEKSVELLKKHNAGGLYNDEIGKILAENERTEEAVPFLSEALLKSIASIMRIVMGYVNTFFAREDYPSAQAILLWEISLLSGLKKDDKPNFFDKISVVSLACLAYSQLKTGDADGARASLERAGILAECFDRSPSYDESDICFAVHTDGASAHDSLGATAADGLEYTVSALDDEALSALWKSITKHEI